ncbi:MAG: hypothetical protein ACT4QE_10345 [Anaerolineales bacterium]
MTRFGEAVVEKAALDWYAGLGYAVASGLAIVPGEPGTDRGDYGDEGLNH